MQDIDYPNYNIYPHKSLDKVSISPSENNPNSTASIIQNIPINPRTILAQTQIDEQSEIDYSSDTSHQVKINLGLSQYTQNSLKSQSNHEKEATIKSNNNFINDTQSMQSSYRLTNQTSKPKQSSTLSNSESQYCTSSNLQPNKLVCDNQISIQHYYIEDELTAIPYHGQLISYFNNSPIQTETHPKVLNSPFSSQNEKTKNNSKESQHFSLLATNRDIQFDKSSNKDDIKMTPHTQYLTPQHVTIDSENQFHNSQTNQIPVQMNHDQKDINGVVENTQKTGNNTIHFQYISSTNQNSNVKVIEDQNKNKSNQATLRKTEIVNDVNLKRDITQNHEQQSKPTTSDSTKKTLNDEMKPELKQQQNKLKLTTNQKEDGKPSNANQFNSTENETNLASNQQNHEIDDGGSTKRRNKPILHMINDLFLNVHDREALRKYKSSKLQTTKPLNLNEPSNGYNSTNNYFQKDDQNKYSPSPQIKDELQFVPEITLSPRTGQINSKKKSTGKSATNRTELLLQHLFVDDGIPISFFDFDFATSYVVENLDSIPEIKPKNDFPTIHQLETKEAANKLNQKEVNQIIDDYFLAFTDDSIDKSFSLTSLTQPFASDFQINNETKQIDLISATSFFSFTIGKESSHYSPDRLHIFTWHNIGIPPNQIAKNILSYFSAPTDLIDHQIQANAAIQYFLIWIRYFPTDFIERSHRLADTFSQLSKILQSMSPNSTALNILCLLVDQLSQLKIKPSIFSHHLSPPCFKQLTKTTQLINLTADPDLLLSHLTFIDLQMLHKLQRIEFIKSNWKNHPDISKNFQAMMKRFNNLVQFIISSILVESVKRRARNISYWIKMMYSAKKTRNYHLLAIIDSALSSLPIMRLTDSWSKVNNNALLVFIKLHNYFRKKENQIEALNDPSITVPFIGTFVVQLDHFDENDYQTQLNGSMAYNLAIQRKSLSVIEEIFLPWGVSLTFELDRGLLKECLELKGTITDPNEMFDLSLKYDPLKHSEKNLLEQFLTNKQ